MCPHCTGVETHCKRKKILMTSELEALVYALLAIQLPESSRFGKGYKLQALSCQHRARCRARTHRPRDHGLS
uniref:Uncharacterized protein n=1 Tax=Lynx canadensis TaxID=61383 RepID=A0A667IDV7_LYNCA